jgi:putative hydrolase of the HAD superfamily
MIPEHLAAHLPPLAPVPTGQTPVLPAPRDIDAVLFDVYGTLFISGSGDISLAQHSNGGTDSLRGLFLKYGLDMPPGSLRQRFFTAIEKSHDQSRQAGVDYPEVEIDLIWQQVAGFNSRRRAQAFAVEYETLVNPVGPMPHLGSVLDACRRSGRVMGIISNAQFFTPLLFEWFLDAPPEKLGFDPELLLYSWQWGVAKPSEKLYRLAGQRLAARGIAPHKTLYLGNDMLNDILPACAAGFQTALFAGDKRSLRLRPDDPRCAGLKPDLVITDLIQLAKWL